MDSEMKSQVVDVNRDFNVTTVSVFGESNSKLVARISASGVELIVRAERNTVVFTLDANAARVLAQEIK